MKAEEVRVDTHAALRLEQRSGGLDVDRLLRLALDGVPLTPIIRL